MARYLVDPDGTLWVFRSEEAFGAYAELRERGFGPDPEEHGAEKLGPAVFNNPPDQWEEWRKGEWRDKKAFLPGESYEEDRYDVDEIIALVHGGPHYVAPLPWEPRQFEQFGASTFIVSKETGKVVAQCHWAGGNTGFELLATAPSLLLRVAKEVRRLQAQLDATQRDCDSLGEMAADSSDKFKRVREKVCSLSEKWKSYAPDAITTWRRAADELDGIWKSD